MSREDYDDCFLNASDITIMTIV